MKATTIGQYVGTIGNAVNEQQLFIKKLLTALQLLKPQSKEFSNQIIVLSKEFDEISSKTIDTNDDASQIDTFTRQIQKDIESLNLQVRVLKSAGASSRKGQVDLTALEKSKKLKQSFKEYQNESSMEISEIKSSLAKNSSELKNSGETMTNLTANLQAIRDELNTLKNLIKKDEIETMATQIKDVQVEIEALKSLTEVIHKGIVSKETLLKMKQSDERTINILKNSIQNLKDELDNVKLLKQGKIPKNFFDHFESLDQSVNSIQDEIQNIRDDINDKSSLITQTQQDISEIKTDTEKLFNLQNETENSSIPERINTIEEKVNTVAGHSIQFDQILNSQKDQMKNLKEEFLPDLANRLSQIETQVSEISIENLNASSMMHDNSKIKQNDEYQDLNQKVEQMIQDIQSSNISKRSISNRNMKPNVPRTVDTLRNFQKALLAQEQADKGSLYQHIDPSQLPIVVQSIDQLMSEVYSEMYKIRDQLTKEISTLKKYSIPLKVDDEFQKKND